MKFHNPEEYIKKNWLVIVMKIAILLVYTLLIIVGYKLYFIKSYYNDKPAIAAEMKEKVKSYYQPEAVKLIPVMSRTVSAGLDKDIIKVLYKDCKSTELIFNIKTIDPLLTNRTDISFEIENTGPKFEDCNFTITAVDKAN